MDVRYGKKMFVVGEIKQLSYQLPEEKEYLLCDGREVSRTDYVDLFLKIGETYGNGDGSNTFNLPDLRSRFPRGAGTGTGLSTVNAGEQDGEESHTLTPDEMPSHSHDMQVNSTADSGVSDIPGSRYLGVGNAGINTRYADAHDGTTLASDVVTSTGTGNAHNNVPPYVGVYFYIRHKV